MRINVNRQKKEKMNHQSKVAVAYVDDNFLMAIKERQEREEQLINATKSKASLELNEFYEKRDQKLQERRRATKSKELVLLQERKFCSVKDEFQVAKSMMNLEELTTNDRFIEVVRSYIYGN